MSAPSSQSKPRELWSGRLGFVLAAVGSAVGLGNMWRFSYLTAENGGAAFVLLYIVMTLLIGLPVMLAELTLGRGARKSPILALVHFGGRGWGLAGLLFVVTGFLILSYYSVIAGWTLRYAFEALFLGFPEDPGAHFEGLASGTSATLWHLAFMAVTTGIVMGGIKGGIERVALVLMPLLGVLVIGIALYAATLDGAAGGYGYYLFHLDLSAVASFEVIKQAAGQAFFSLSLGMGAMLTYASYLSRENHLPNESLMIAGADFAAALVAGLVVFPLIFALGLQEAVGGSTLGALFITLPKAFAAMGVAGRVVGSLFFAALVFAALTSAISLLEVVVSSAMDGLGWPRRRAALVFGAVIALCGVYPALSLAGLDLMDSLAGNVFLVLGGLLLAVFVGYRMKDPIAEVSAGTDGIRWFSLWRSLLRYAVPLVLATVLLFSAHDAWQKITALF